MRIQNVLEHPVIMFAIRLIVGTVFLLFGVVKAIEPKTAFFTAIGDYQMVPEAMIPAFGYAMIGMEIVFGLFLIVGLFTRISSWMILALLLAFLIALAQAMFRELELSDCGCSGSMIKLGESPMEVFVRDVVMFVMMLYFIVLDKKRWTVDRWLEK